MNKVSVKDTTISIPVYPVGAPEKLPVFAENRVHQRMSGNPYPNAVTADVRASEKPERRELRAVVIENDYIRVTVLPEYGGRVFSAEDKTTGRDFLYRQHVIKPALIGLLGPWISGGIEFNWPTHHRPSTFLPTDVTIEENEHESVVWLTSSDVFDRMTGSVGIALRDDRAYFETRVRLYNRTPERRSFLWWENAAVPAGPDLRIFFPQDVGHVFFHYRRNTTAYPVTGGWFNGHRIPENTDISRHGNTPFPTSYFSAASRYDYFGSYDESTGGGVVHVADHHISPGKKMFTWAYDQLARTWEKALTDTDGPYLELMAGSYSDNQPDLSWLALYEEKRFSQYWYPISDTGVPCFANLDMAVSMHSDRVVIRPTGSFADCEITVSDENREISREKTSLDVLRNHIIELTGDVVGEVRIVVKSAGKTLVDYTTMKPPKDENVPVIEGFPTPDECRSSEEAFLTGTHVVGYRDPSANAERYFEKAVALSGDNFEAYASLAECVARRGDFESAYRNITRAWETQTMRDMRPVSGRIAFLYGNIALALGKNNEAEEAFWSAYFTADTKDAALVRIAELEGLRGDFIAAKRHASESRAGVSADVIRILAGNRLGEKTDIREKLREYPMSQALRFAAVICGEYDKRAFYDGLSDEPSQTCIDIFEDLSRAGFADEAAEALRGLTMSGKRCSCMVWYLLGERPETKDVRGVFPHRECERKALETAFRNGDAYAGYLLGCLLCGRREYARAHAMFDKSGLPEGTRGSAVCLWKLGRKNEALEKLRAAAERMPDDDQVLWELFRVENRLGASTGDAEKLLMNRKRIRDDICTEYAVALCRRGESDRAVTIMEGHEYVPCEGGEGAVADAWILANRMLADRAFGEGLYETALGLYEKAETLPGNLGAGWWNDAKKAPLRYAEGLCLEKLGREKQANERFGWITSLLTDFFSDMALPELDIIKIKAYRKLGDTEVAEKTIRSARARFEKEINRRDSGFFGTTPFFDSFYAESDAMAERHAHYGRLLAELEKVSLDG